jgi:hypothetical protein
LIAHRSDPYFDRKSAQDAEVHPDEPGVGGFDQLSHSIDLVGQQSPVFLTP